VGSITQQERHAADRNAQREAIGNKAKALKEE